MNSETAKRLRTALLIVAGVIISGGIAYAIGGTPGTATGEASNLDVVLLVSYVLLALVVSFFCSIAEAVLLSVTPSYIERLRETKPRRASRLKKLKLESVDRSLAAILTLNTIAHTIGAIGAGAKATIVFGSAWFGLFSAVMTLLILFLSEIIPKTLGAVYWTHLVGPVVPFVRGMVFLLWPVVWLAERLTHMVSGGKKGHVFSREEFLAMARIGEETGDIEGNESRIIRNLFRFGVLKTGDIMTPRMVITALDESTSLGEALDVVTEQPFSRVPVYQETIDHVTGFVLRDDVLLEKAKGAIEKQLANLRRSIHSVPESAPLSSLLEQLLARRDHIAVVIDEHGGTAGIVTLEDLVETLMGLEIMDETDTVENLRTLARKRWEARKKHAAE